MKDLLWEQYERDSEGFVEDILCPSLIHVIDPSWMMICKCGRGTLSITPDGPTCLTCYWEHWPRPADVEDMREVLEITSP